MEAELALGVSLQLSSRRSWGLGFLGFRVVTNSSQSLGNSRMKVASLHICGGLADLPGFLACYFGCIRCPVITGERDDFQGRSNA